MTDKEFWKTIKPFLTNKGCLENGDIMLTDADEMVTDDKTLAKTFKEQYINTVERSSSLKPEKMEFENSGRNILHSIIDRYKNHPSILKACVRYFLSNFYFSPNDSSPKTMKNVFYFI